MTERATTLSYALSLLAPAFEDEPEWLTWAQEKMAERVNEFSATVPLLYRNAHMGTLDAEQSPRMIREWFDAPQAQTLFLVGKIGTGKTHAAMAIVWEDVIRRQIRRSKGPYLSDDWEPALKSAPAALDGLRGDDRDELWEKLTKSSILALDDIGVTRVTDWGLEKLWQLIDDRTSQGRRQVITANLSWVELTHAWGEPLMDRLRCNSLVAQFSGESRRAPIATTIVAS